MALSPLALYRGESVEISSAELIFFSMVSDFTRCISEFSANQALALGTRVLEKEKTNIYYAYTRPYTHICVCRICNYIYIEHYVKQVKKYFKSGIDKNHDSTFR